MKITIKYLLIGVLIVIIIWLISGLIIYNIFDSNEIGPIGDMFGAINSLFSGLALFGIIVSIFIQQKELNLQNEEFRINRLTNILFKQVEYLNLIIDNLTFDVKDIIEPNKKRVSIDKFIMVLDNFSYVGFNESKIKLLNNNEVNIDKVILKSETVFDNFRKLLETSNIENSDILQMKKLLKNNINPFLFPLLSYKTSFIKYEIQNKDSLSELEKGLYNLQITVIRKLSEYDKE